MDQDAIEVYENNNNRPRHYFGKMYQKCNNDRCTSDNIYDVQSITHYGQQIHGQTVMTSKELCNGKPCPLGQRKGLSFLDRKDIIDLYECSKNIYYTTFK